MGTEKALENFI